MTETKLAAIPTHVSASIDKGGRKRPAHISTRHKKVAFSVDSIPPAENASPLDAFIAKHGGAEHLRETLDAMEPHERAKLLDLMAHVDSITPAEVMKKLGIHEPKASEDQREVDEALEQFRTRLAVAKDEGVITSDEYDLVTGICESEGLERALETLQALRAPPAPPPEPVAVVAPEVAAEAAEGAAGIRAALQSQADTIYAKHVEATNKAVRADFEIEKRGIRKWKIPEQMRTDAAQYHQEAAAYLAEWETFCKEHGLNEALS